MNDEHTTNEFPNSVHGVRKLAVTVLLSKDPPEALPNENTTQNYSALRSQRVGHNHFSKLVARITKQRYCVTGYIFKQFALALALGGLALTFLRCSLFLLVRGECLIKSIFISL